MRIVAWCLADLLAALLAVVIVAVAPTKAKQDGEKKDALFLITADWSVNEDADVDLWVLTPSGKPVAYMSRDVGCAQLDMDNRGFIDGHVKLADGTVVVRQSNKETVSLRCLDPGRYVMAVNLYAYHTHDDGQASRVQNGSIGLKVRGEIEGMNPEVKALYAKDVVLDSVGQTINLTSFDLDRDGKLTLADPPLEPVTASYYRHNTSAIP